jgi:hypothetical protein
MELMFPIVSIDTQFDLVMKFQFKYTSEEMQSKQIHLNVFEFVKGMNRKDVTGFMTKIQCPLLMLNFISYKLEDEIDKDIIDPQQSYALELFYLFNDFLTRDYFGAVVGGKVQRIWGCAGNRVYPRMRKRTSMSNVSEHSNGKKTAQELEKFWHKWFGRQQWHDLSLHIIKLFVTSLKTVKYTCNYSYNNHIAPWMKSDRRNIEKQINFETNNSLKNFETSALRNGGTVRLLMQSILILIRGSTFIRLKNFSGSVADIQAADFGPNNDYKYNLKKSATMDQGVTNEQVHELEIDESDHDISNLIEMLHIVWFPNNDLKRLLNHSKQTIADIGHWN